MKKILIYAAIGLVLISAGLVAAALVLAILEPEAVYEMIKMLGLAP